MREAAPGTDDRRRSKRPHSNRLSAELSHVLFPHAGDHGCVPVVLIAGLTVALATTSWAQQPTVMASSLGSAAMFPATPFGTLAQALVHAIDQGGGAPPVPSSTARPRLRCSCMDPARYAAMLDRLAVQSGGLEVVRVREVGAALRVFTRTRKDGRMVGLEIIPASEHPARVYLIGVHPMDARQERFDPRSWPHVKLAEASCRHHPAGGRSAADADVFLRPPAGDDRIIVHEAFGNADASRRIPNTLATRFHIASITKTFTGVAIAQLVGRAGCASTTPSRAFSRGTPTRRRAAGDDPSASDAHVRHTDIFASPTLDRNRVPGPAAELLPAIAGRPLEFEPGARFGYSNSNTVILRAILERVTGQRYHDHLRANVYARAGMRDTEAGTDGQVPRRAIGYAQFTETDPLHIDARRDNEAFIGRSAALDPDNYLSAADLFRFARALRTHRLLSAAMTDSVVTGTVDVGRSAPSRESTASGSTIRRRGALGSADTPAAGTIRASMRTWRCCGIAATR